MLFLHWHQVRTRYQCIQCDVSFDRNSKCDSPKAEPVDYQRKWKRKLPLAIQSSSSIGEIFEFYCFVPFFILSSSHSLAYLDNNEAFPGRFYGHGICVYILRFSFWKHSLLSMHLNPIIGIEYYMLYMYLYIIIMIIWKCDLWFDDASQDPDDTLLLCFFLCYSKCGTCSLVS